MRRSPHVLTLFAVVALAFAANAPAAAASTVGSTTTVTFSLASGEKVAAAGDLKLTIQNFRVDDRSIVLVARVSGTAVAGPVAATFTNVRIVAAITNLRADCAAGTLSFNFRATVPTRGIAVTVAGVPVEVRGALTLRGSVTISTAAIATVDPELAATVGALICEIEALLTGGASLDDVVARLNAVLSNLPLP